MLIIGLIVGMFLGAIIGFFAFALLKAGDDD